MPRILEKHVVGHVTKGIKEEASKSQRRGVGGGVGMCVRGSVGGEKKRTCPGGCQHIYIYPDFTKQSTSMAERLADC